MVYSSTFGKVVAVAAILPLIAMAFAAFPAQASEEGCGEGPFHFFCGGGDSVKVENNNSASVTNEVKVSANTGENTANGGDGGKGGSGGDTGNAGNGGEGGDAEGYSLGDQNGGNGGDGGWSGAGGEGGNGGNGGLGGIIETGDATSEVTIENNVNYNKTKINSCGCDEESELDLLFSRGDKVRVENNNSAEVRNGVDVYVGTGENTANGGRGGRGKSGGDSGNAGNGGEGGDAGDDEYSYEWILPVLGNQNAGDGGTGGDSGNGGDGGDGGNGDWGGEIRTGHADSVVDIVNLINHNITRVRR